MLLLGSIRSTFEEFWLFFYIVLKGGKIDLRGVAQTLILGGSVIVLEFFCLLLCIETKVLVLRTLLIDALVCVAYI